MQEIWFPFKKFPLFNAERRPVLAQGEAQCVALKIEPSIAGDPGRVTWRVTAVTMCFGEAETEIDLADDAHLRQDFGLWLRGSHGAEIERILRGSHTPQQGDDVHEE